MNHWQRAVLLALATLVAIPACGSRAEEAPASPAPLPDSAVPRTVSEWITAAKKFNEGPADDQALRGLLASRAFDQLDASAIEDPTTQEFFPVLKQLVYASASRSSDDLISVVIFSFGVFRSFSLAGQKYIAGFAPDDPTLAARLRGLQQVSAGAATMVRGALKVAKSATAKKRGELLAALTSPTFLSWQTRESLTALVEETDKSTYPAVHAAFVQQLAALP